MVVFRRKETPKTHFSLEHKSSSIHNLLSYRPPFILELPSNLDLMDFVEVSSNQDGFSDLQFWLLQALLQDSKRDKIAYSRKTRACLN